MASISRKPVSLPHATIIATPPGVGKTELAAHYPKPLFMMVGRDLGLISLMNSGRVPADISKFDTNYENWEEFLEDLDQVENDDHGCETLVIDTGSALQYYLMQYVVKNEYGGDESKFMDYGGKGWPLCRTPWQWMLSKLDRIRFKRKMRILMLAHTTVGNVNNPEGENYHSHNPEWHPSIANLTNGWADNVLFGNMQILTQNLKGNAKAKAKMGDRRVLHVQAAGGFYAKNRWGLRDPIPMGTCGADAYLNLKTAIEKAVEKQTRNKSASGTKDKAPEKTKDTPAAKKDTAKEPPDKAQEEKGDAGDEMPQGEYPTWVATFYKRINACRKFGVLCSLWPDIVSAYDAAKEQDRIDWYPDIIKHWAAGALKLAGGDNKYIDSTIRRLDEASHLPTGSARALLPREPGE